MKRGLLLLAAMVIGAVTAQGQNQYVFMYNDGGTYHILSYSGSEYNTSDATVFSSVTCIWSGTSGGAFGNQNRYLYWSQGLWYAYTSSDNITISNDYKAYNRYNNNNYYIRYDGGWVANTTNSNNVVVYLITGPQAAAWTTPVSISGSQSTFTNLGAFTYSADAAYRPAYYTLTGNGTYYVVEGGTPSSSAPTGSITYTWTLNDGTNDDGHVRINASTGEVTYYNSYASNTTTTIKVTATHTASGATSTDTKAITFNALPVADPTGITATDKTIGQGDTWTADNYSFVVADGYSPYRYVTATSADNTIATVSNTSGTFTVTGVEVGSTTITITAYKQGNSVVAATTTFTLTVAEPQTGVSGGKVILNDYEPHSWSYYSDPECPVRSLSPADVKITYYGNGIVMSNNDDYTAGTNNYVSPGDNNYVGGAKVNVGGENENTFVYYKTLERGANTQTAYTFSSSSQSAAESRCPYTTIPNPFQVRPTYGGTTTTNTANWAGWRGFQCWRLKSVSGGKVFAGASGGDALAVGAIINAETEYYFAPDAEYGMDVQLEAVWAIAYVVKAGNGATEILNNSVGYERNFVVLNTTNANYNFGAGNSTGNTKRITSINRQATITRYLPNGVRGQNDDATCIRGAAAAYHLTLEANTKFENVVFVSMTERNLTAEGHNLIVGRGCSGTVGTVRGLSDNTSGAVEYTIRLESGTFGTFNMIDGTTHTHSGTVSAKTIFGSDYDRAKSDNDKLSIGANNTVYGASSYQQFTSNTNRNNLTYDWNIKSGKVQASKGVAAGSAAECIYMGNSGNGNDSDGNRYQGKRRMIMEGGEVCNIAGGLNNYGNSYATYIVNDGWALQIRIKGGTVRGSVYGAAEFAGASGDRQFIITGGTINGWVAGGANGTHNDGGELYGSTALYIGGTTVVGSESGGTHVGGYNSSYGTNGADGGNVFGAGCGILPNNGNYQNGTVGRVNSSVVAIADEATIWRDVYGGGNYGWVRDNGTTEMYILGGTVNGSVFGGSNNQQGQEVTITMKGGTIKGNTIGDATRIGGLYGGSNSWGTINDNVTMQINGGQVGTSSKNANIHGGGYGSSTAVNGNVEVNVGSNDGSGNTSGDAVIYGDVYGGSADGSVNDATSDHTYVTLNAGTIYGSLYGGGLGITNTNCNVNGAVQVVVNGGSVKPQASGDNPASVFGCNNAMGSPKSTVTVTINKTDATVTDGSGNKTYAINGVYGGGNQAHYDYDNANYPTVTINGCTTSIKDVYGGGNAAAVPSTHVTINGGDIDRVFGGGNGESGTPAHIGYKNKTENSTSNAYTANGNVTLDINGGTINQIFGGSNAHGTIKGSIAMDITKSGSCEMHIGEVYGGGNEAAGNAGTITIGCTGGSTEGIGDLYGGANAANVNNSISLSITGGSIERVFGGNNTSGTISGTIGVTVNWNTANPCEYNYLGSVFGGGNLATYSAPTGNLNYPAVSILNGTVSHNVYGGGKGDPNDATKGVVTGNPVVTIGDNTAGHCAIVMENVYGGGDAAAITGNSSVTYSDNNASSYVGKLFGGGNAASVSGTSTVTLTSGKVTAGVYGGCNASGSVGAVTIALNGGQVGATGTGNGADVYGGGFGSATTTTGAIAVTLNGTTVYGDLYGGSALGSVNGSTSHTTTLNINSNTLHGTIYGGGKGDNSTTAVSNGNVLINYTTANTSLTGLYGGANVNGNVKGDITLNVLANVGASGNGNSINVFGGGLGHLTNTEGNVTVNVGAADGSNNPVIYGDIYGGSALGNVNNAVADLTTVSILNGTVHGNVYGGGLGDATLLANGYLNTSEPTIEAIVYGTVHVNIGHATVNTSAPTIDGKVFGCNNLAGTPKGHVYVDVYRTAHSAANTYPSPEPASASAIPTPAATEFAIQEVYGGGNLAHYITTLDNASTHVHIHNCDNTIQYVYGGGNAADTKANEVTIDGGRFEYVFGGGNGKGNGNPGANVAGNATVNVNGGIINYVFGGSNTLGVVNGTSSMTFATTPTCTRMVKELYGGGNMAPGGTVNMTIPCGVDGLNVVFGGSRNADIGTEALFNAGNKKNVTITIEGGTLAQVFGGNNQGGIIYGDVTLNLKGGTIGDAFGGNNAGGNVKGVITVNVEDAENTTCPLVLTNVFGGGKDAAYTPAEATISGPLVNIKHKKSGTSITGSVFGGGQGSTATVTANPVVTVGDLTDANHIATIGGDVYGGGDAADVVGTTTVLIQKCNTVISGDVYGGGNAADVNGTSVTIDGGTITGMVFGGGHGNKKANPQTEANVNGNVAVDVTGGTINKVFGGSNSKGNISGTVAVNIDKGATSCPMHINEVYGGGNEAAGNAGTITIGCTGTEANGEGIGDVYGGANAADINSNITLEINGGRINNVFGGNNTSGTISGAIEVNIEKTQNCDWYVGNVYGGGNLAPYTGSPAVNVKNGTVSLNVYGGGKGAGAVVTGNPVVMVGDLTPAHSAYVAAVTGDVYGGGDAAAVTGTTSVTLQKANSTAGRLFGGGNAAGVSSTATVTLTAGTVSTGVYGGCNAEGTVGGNITVALNGGTVGIDGTTTDVVYGGGYGHNTATGGDVNVTLNGATVYGSLYGGSALGSVNGSTSNTTTVTLSTNGLNGSVFGGGMGSGTTGSTQATTLGNTVVNINIYSPNLTGIYGGANVNGDVAGDINVNVEANVGTDASHTLSVYGGGFGQYTTTDGNVTVTVGNSSTPTIYGDLYGGSALGEVGANGKIAKVDFKAGTLNGSIYGGGMGQNTPSAVSATVSGGTEVAVSAGTITNSIYGGCNERGNVVGDITVDITGGTIGANGSPASVFGGGYGANTATQGDVIVNINGSGVTVWGDVYGGSGFGNVNNESSDATTVNILNGEVKQHVFGGGLGSKSPAYAAAVNGVVTVNIGSDNGDGTYSGNAIIGGNVYGCNNTNGSPQQNVTVNIYATNHPSGTLVGESGYAIANVFGGGKEADFNANGKKAYVNVYSCANTIGRVFGGGDAAAVTGTEVMIQGGRFNYVFGGGNGEVQAANVGAGGITLELHGGTINTLVSGSNTLGTISGPINVTVNNNSPCSEEVTDFFGGSNQVDIATNVTTTIECGAGTITNVYGGSNAANITGNVILNVKGGTMTNVFGGSKGVADDLATPGDEGVAANIDGNVTLNLYGGTMVNAFGGSDQNGNITGNIAVNVLDHEGTCKLDVTNIYGAGNVTPYTPNSSSATSPTVNVMHVKVSDAVADDPATTDVDESRPAIPGIRGSVFGGGLGNTAVVTAQPRVNIGYTSAMSSLPTVQYPTTISSANYTAIVCGSLYGGGDAAAVTGSPIVTIDNGSSMVKERIIGGGNAANVTGNTHVIVNDGVFGTGTGASRGVYGGCNTTGTVSGNAVVDVLAGTFGTQAAVNNKVSYNIHGGGFGADTRVNGNVTVNYGVDNGSASDYPKLYGDIYGGSALGHVNTDGSNTTTVYVLNGSFGFYGERRNYQMVDGDTVGGYIIQHGGNIYGGGLGQAYVAAAAAIPDDPATPQDESRPAQEEVPAIAAKVYGVVHVNIGRDNGGGSYSGKANLALCNVYGCNNAQGSPQQNVYVDVWQTAHTTKNTASYVAGLDDDVTELFAIRNVYGGGNAADFNPDDGPETKKVYNYIHTCENTVENVYGGGNAASVTATDVFVEGGRYNYIFAGGNGQITAADVEGNADMVIRAGRVGWHFEGCNMQGVIRGTVFVQAGCGTGDQAPCHCGDLKVENYYFGANMATVVGDKISEVVCGGPNPFDYRNVYAGSRLATIYGNIVLTVRGGTIGNLYGGSEGNDVISADIRKAPADWDDIDNFPVEHQAALREHFDNHAHDEDYGKGGNITLYLYGGDIENVFGGSNYRGTVEGDIHIIVDSSTSCPLDIDYLYGGSQLSKYAPDGNTTDPDRVSPLVELRNGHVNYDVFGGSRGGRPTHPWGNGVLYSNPKVIVGSKTTGKFRIGGNLYGGGSAGDVNGDTEIKIDGHLDAGSNPTTNIIGNVFGGGKSGDVNGNSKVTIVTE